MSYLHNVATQMAPKTVISKPAAAKPKVVKTKVYKMPGQKRDTPSKNDALYRFYTSLLKQNPNSEMALKWCMEHGTLSQKKAEKAVLLFDMKKLKV